MKKLLYLCFIFIKFNSFWLTNEWIIDGVAIIMIRIMMWMVMAFSYDFQSLKYLASIKRTPSTHQTFTVSVFFTAGTSFLFYLLNWHVFDWNQLEFGGKRLPWRHNKAPKINRDTCYRNFIWMHLLSLIMIPC